MCELMMRDIGTQSETLQTNIMVTIKIYYIDYYNNLTIIDIVYSFNCQHNILHLYN